MSLFGVGGDAVDARIAASSVSGRADTFRAREQALFVGLTETVGGAGSSGAGLRQYPPGQDMGIGDGLDGEFGVAIRLDNADKFDHHVNPVSRRRAGGGFFLLRQHADGGTRQELI